MKDYITHYIDQFRDASLREVVSFFLSEFKGEIAFSTSLGAEDQMLTDMICRIDPGTRIFTLDTGRMFQETYDILDITEKKYGIKIQVFFPDPGQVEEMVMQKGINLFYESIENRKFCCHIRKIEPLKRALNGMKVWISGVRKEQSVTRQDFELVQWDETLQVIKVLPLVDWTESQVWEYIRGNNIPYNELHNKGFPSIGCLPCTRAVKPGETSRSGRWWWELPENKECGLHQ